MNKQYPKVQQDQKVDFLHWTNFGFENHSIIRSNMKLKTHEKNAVTGR